MHDNRRNELDICIGEDAEREILYPFGILVQT